MAYIAKTKYKKYLKEKKIEAMAQILDLRRSFFFKFNKEQNLKKIEAKLSLGCFA